MFPLCQSRTFSAANIILACLATLFFTTALHVTYAVYTVKLLQQMLPVQKEYSAFTFYIYLFNANLLFRLKHTLMAIILHNCLWQYHQLAWSSRAITVDINF